MHPTILLALLNLNCFHFTWITLKKDDLVSWYDFQTNMLTLKMPIMTSAKTISKISFLDLWGEKRIQIYVNRKQVDNSNYSKYVNSAIRMGLHFRDNKKFRKKIIS